MIHGHQVTLRPWRELDLAFFKTLRNDIDTQAALASRARPNSAVRVANWLTSKDDDSGCAFFVIEHADGSAPVGFIELRSIDTVSRNAMLGLAVTPSVQGKGLAAEAMSLLEQYAAETFNLRKIILEVVTSNERAVAFYRSAGFAVIGTMTEHHYQGGKWHDMHLMEKRLASTNGES